MSMVLKEAFRYQNYLDTILNNVMYYLESESNVMEIIEDHQRTKAWTEATDEKKSNVEDRKIQIPVDTIIAFAIDVYKEKEALSKKINSAKLQHCSTMDLDIFLNKTRQQILCTLKRMNSNRDKKYVKHGAGSGYCFNSEGNQVMYRYDIAYDSKASFKRKEVKKIISDLFGESNKVSNTIDYWRTTIPVDHVPKYDGESSMEELLEEYASEKA